MNFYNYFSLFSLSMFIYFSSTCSMEKSSLVVTDLINRLNKPVIDLINTNETIINYIIYLAQNIETTDHKTQELVKKLKTNPNFTLNLYQNLYKEISNETKRSAFTKSWEKIIGPIIPKRIMNPTIPEKIVTEPTASSTTVVPVPRVIQHRIEILENTPTSAQSQQQTQTATIPLTTKHQKNWTIPNVSEYSTEKPQPGHFTSVINTIVSTLSTIYYGIKALINKLFGSG